MAGKALPIAGAIAAPFAGPLAPLVLAGTMGASKLLGGGGGGQGGIPISPSNLGGGILPPLSLPQSPPPIRSTISGGGIGVPSDPLELLIRNLGRR